MEMNIDLVVFDMAGTTVRDDDAVNRCLREAFAKRSQVTREEVNAVMGLPKPVAIQLLLEKHFGSQAVSSALVNEVHEDFLQRMLQHYQTSPGIEPMPHALETFWQLKEA